jgi:hypothetical protein
MPGTSVPEASYLDSCCELEGQCDISGEDDDEFAAPHPATRLKSFSLRWEQDILSLRTNSM